MKSALEKCDKENQRPMEASQLTDDENAQDAQDEE